MVDLHVRPIAFDGIVFKQSDERIRADCHQPFAGLANGCPNYGTTYGCPPHAPDLAAFKSALAGYATFYLIYAEAELSGDAVQDKAKYASIQMHVDAFIDFMQDSIPGIFIIHGYGCHYCKRVSEGRCTCPDEPCRHPDKRTYSLSVALDIVATMNAAGIPMELDPAKGSRVYRRIGFVASKEDIDFNRLIKEFEE
ncbi:MAG: hypothetical protein JW839_10405 [Candidatus Lokiarchaeota archaeon]|nr:hypothetical protein [Candidatus Lokiarchaeota archaeon]